MKKWFKSNRPHMIRLMKSVFIFLICWCILQQVIYFQTFSDFRNLSKSPNRRRLTLALELARRRPSSATEARLASHPPPPHRPPTAPAPIPQKYPSLPRHTTAARQPSPITPSATTSNRLRRPSPRRKPPHRRTTTLRIRTPSTTIMEAPAHLTDD